MKSGLRVAIKATTVFVFVAGGANVASANDRESLGPSRGDRFQAKTSSDDPNPLYLLGRSALHRSADAGAAWQLPQTRQPAGGSFLTKAIDPNKSSFGCSWVAPGWASGSVVTEG